ncbi:MAG: hypothetical protein ABI164_05890, partial [Acidobacteriaceae bacterium]
GALHMRAVFQGGKSPVAVSSDWVHLATLVRLPAFTSLLRTTDLAAPCTMEGSSFFLLSAVSADPAFSSPGAVPDGYTGTTLTVPHPAAGTTLFFKLRDDPEPIDSVTVPLPGDTPPAASAHAHRAKSGDRPAKGSAAN